MRADTNIVFTKKSSKGNSSKSQGKNKQEDFPPIGFGGTIGTVDSKEEGYINLSRNRSASNKSKASDLSQQNSTKIQKSKTSGAKPKEIGRKYGGMMQDQIFDGDNQETDQLIVSTRSFTHNYRNSLLYIRFKRHLDCQVNLVSGIMKP